MIVLDAKKLCKNYVVGELTIPVLHEINLSVGEDEFLGIIGPSGSGKTTLLYVLSGMEPSSSGNVMVFGKNWKERSKDDIQNLRKTEIAFVFQFYNLLPNLTVYENIQLPMILAKNSDFNRIDEVLEWVGMTDFKEYFPNQLSGGMQQRVAIARALINQPKIIFADEPTGNLDHQNGVEIMALLKRIQEEQKITILMVTHNPENLSSCTRTVSLLDGRIIRDESV